MTNYATTKKSSLVESSTNKNAGKESLADLVDLVSRLEQNFKLDDPPFISALWAFFGTPPLREARSDLHDAAHGYSAYLAARSAGELSIRYPAHFCRGFLDGILGDEL